MYNISDKNVLSKNCSSAIRPKHRPYKLHRMFVWHTEQHTVTDYVTATSCYCLYVGF